MKISKYIHSCLVIEHQGYNLLFDPGAYTFTHPQVTPQTFARTDAIVITHIHADHFDIGNLLAITALNQATIYTNAQVGTQLQKAGLPYTLLAEGQQQIGSLTITTIPVTHATLLNATAPPMYAFVINNRLLHPVDTLNAAELQAYKGIDVMLMITMAPFAAEVDIAAFTEQMQPKAVLPVHDGYAIPAFVQARQANYKAYLQTKGIGFVDVPQPGDSYTL